MAAHFTDEFLIHYGVPGMKKGQQMSPEEKAAKERLRYQRQVAAAGRKAAAAQRKQIALQKKAAREAEKKRIADKRTENANLLRSHRMTQYQAAVERMKGKTFRPGMIRTLPIDRSRLNQQFGSIAEMRKNAARRR